MNTKAIRAAAQKGELLQHRYFGRVKVTGLIVGHGGELYRVEMRSASYDARQRRAIDRRYGEYGSNGSAHVLTARPPEFRLLSPIGGAA